MKIVLNLQFLTCKKYSEHRSAVNNCNFSKLQFFKCTSTVISMHIFAVYIVLGLMGQFCRKLYFKDSHVSYMRIDRNEFFKLKIAI